MAGCDTNQNNTIVTAIEMVLEKTNGGIACAAEGGDWFWVSLKSGHTFTAAIWDGQAQVYFNLYDATGAHLLAQDDDSGNITYTNDGEQIITILLKAYNETNPESEIRYTFKPRIEKQL